MKSIIFWTTPPIVRRVKRRPDLVNYVYKVDAIHGTSGDALRNIVYQSRRTFVRRLPYCCLRTCTGQSVCCVSLWM